MNEIKYMGLQKIPIILINTWLNMVLMVGLGGTTSQDPKVELLLGAMERRQE